MSQSSHDQKTIRRGPPKGSQNRIKVAGKPASSFLHMRCRPDQKESWTEAAKAEGKSLSDWVQDTLDASCQ